MNEWLFITKQLGPNTLRSQRLTLISRQGHPQAGRKSPLPAPPRHPAPPWGSGGGAGSWSTRSLGSQVWATIPQNSRSPRLGGWQVRPLTGGGDGKSWDWQRQGVPLGVACAGFRCSGLPVPGGYGSAFILGGSNNRNDHFTASEAMSSDESVSRQRCFLLRAGREDFFRASPSSMW